MKTLFRICLVLFLVLIIAAGVGYFLLTRPAFQKKLVEGKLPEGSSLKYVHITTSNIELTDLQLRMPDGTTAKVDSLRSGFSPLAALFDETIRLRGLTVDGFVIKLPEVTAATTAGNGSSGATSSSSSAPVDSVSQPAEPASEGDPGSLTDALYALGEVDWLLDVDSITFNGALIDASRNRYSFDVNSGAIAPGAESTLTAQFKLQSKEALQGGLKDFSSEARIVFTQLKTGGFERMRVESLTEGSGASGAQLLSVSQTLELAIDSFGESAQVDLSFNADLPNPAVFAPELGALQGLSLEGALRGSSEGNVFTLSQADVDVASKGQPVVSVKLKQSLRLGAEQDVVGQLMEATLTQLPLAWVNPWLGAGLELSGAPLSAHIAVSGEKGGALQVRTLAPIELGPFSLSQRGQALLREVTLRANPVLRVEPDQTIRFDLGDFALLDRYGAFVSGTLTGAKANIADDALLAGLQTKARLDLGLAELLNQHVLDGRASVLAGQAKLQLDIDGAADYPAKVQASVIGLRARDMPGSRQDYRLAAQLKQNNAGAYALGANLAAGSENRPSTTIQLGGQVDIDAQPVPFKVDLTAPRVTQTDIDLLLAAVKAQPSEPTSSTPVTPPARNSSASPRTSLASEPITDRPAWADLNGDIAIRIDELILTSGQTVTGLNAQAKVSEPLLSVDQIAAKMQDGSLGGNAQVSYNPRASKAYQVASTLQFEEVDPSIFSKKRSGSFPVKGRFNGNFNLTGSGPTLEAALDDAEGDLLITGRKGVLTAFELDNRSQLGLLGAGILGQSLDRPGITALAQAVPYFKDMQFDNFTLKLVRAEDKKVRIPELSFIGQNLRINGQGFIAASSLKAVLDQPLDLTLGFGAKGRLVDYLQTLGLLQPATSEDGFRNWNKDIKIGGTLGDPDTTALKELLNDAARRAFQEPKKTPPPATQTPPAEGEMLLPGEGTPAPTETEPKKKSKEEQLKDDIDMGLDLLNSVFG